MQKIYYCWDMPEILGIPEEMEGTFLDDKWTKRQGNATQQLGWALGRNAEGIFADLFGGSPTKIECE